MESLWARALDCRAQGLAVLRPLRADFDRTPVAELFGHVKSGGLERHRLSSFDSNGLVQIVRLQRQVNAAAGLATGGAVCSVALASSDGINAPRVWSVIMAGSRTQFAGQPAVYRQSRGTCRTRRFLSGGKEESQKELAHSPLLFPPRQMNGQPPLGLDMNELCPKKDSFLPTALIVMQG